MPSHNWIERHICFISIPSLFSSRGKSPTRLDFKERRGQTQTVRLEKSFHFPPHFFIEVGSLNRWRLKKQVSLVPCSLSFSNPSSPLQSCSWAPWFQVGKAKNVLFIRLYFFPPFLQDCQFHLSILCCLVTWKDGTLRCQFSSERSLQAMGVNIG